VRQDNQTTGRPSETGAVLVSLLESFRKERLALLARVHSVWKDSRLRSGLLRPLGNLGLGDGGVARLAGVAGLVEPEYLDYEAIKLARAVRYHLVSVGQERGESRRKSDSGRREGALVAGKLGFVACAQALKGDHLEGVAGGGLGELLVGGGEKPKHLIAELLEAGQKPRLNALVSVCRGNAGRRRRIPYPAGLSTRLGERWSRRTCTRSSVGR
jgi:hypothetical protein